MSASLAIDFVVAGGAALGLGHVMRSAAIAEAAIQQGHSVRVFFEGDEGALSAWRSAAPGTMQAQILPWSAYPADRAAPVGVLDFPIEKASWIALLSENNARSLVLDDPRSVDAADLTINPALHHGLTPPSPRESSAGGARLLEGPAYSVLAQSHRATPYQPWAQRPNLLLSIGGADPHQATPKLAPWISDILDALRHKATHPHPFQNKHVVLGGAFADPQNKTRDALHEAGWKVHSALRPAKMAELMASTRLAVMGFGTSLTELAWHGTPHLSVTHHRFDMPHAAALEARGVGRHLGYAGELDGNRVKAVLRQSICDPQWQSASADTARAMLQGGNGVDRILDEIKALARRPLQSRRETSAAARPIGGVIPP